MRIRFTVFFFSFLLLSGALKSQDFETMTSLSASGDFLQIKESLNEGLVYSGPQLRFGFRKTWEINERNLMYDADLGSAAMFSKGMFGLNIHVKPVDLLYNAYVRVRKITISGGPWVKMEYNYQLYPHQQSGYSFYFTNYTVGLGISAKYQQDRVYLRLQVKNSLFGMVARPPEDRDPYFFELSASTYFKDQHKGFTGGSFNLYNDTQVELLYANPNKERWGYSYTFSYFSYAQDPKLKSLRHGISIIYYFKKVI